MKFKPTMTLRFGAAHNSLTIVDEAKTTTFDMNKMRRDDKQTLQRVAVTAWCHLNGVEWSPSPHRKKKNVKNRTVKTNGKIRRKAKVRADHHA